jgi:hypothetical protein
MYDPYDDDVFNRQQYIPLEFYPPIDQTMPFQPPMFNPPMESTLPFRPPFITPPTRPQRIRRCLYRNTFVRLNNGQSFWFYPTDIRRERLIGFRWGRLGWVSSSIELGRIRSFNCN